MQKLSEGTPGLLSSQPSLRSILGKFKPLRPPCPSYSFEPRLSEMGTGQSKPSASIPSGTEVLAAAWLD